MLQKFRIGTRLALGFGGLIAASVVAFILAVLSGSQGQADIARTAHVAQERIGAVHAMRELQLQLVSSIQSAGLQSNAAQANRDADAYRAAMKALQARELAFTELGLSAEEKGLLDAAVALRRQAAPVADEAIKYASAFAGDEAAKLLTGSFAKLQREWVSQLDRLATLQEQRATVQAQAIADENRKRSVLLAAFLLTTTVCGVGFAVALTRSVTRPLRQAADAASSVAAGNLALRIEVQGHDEAADLMRSLQTMAQQLAAMVREVRQSSQSIALASDEISRGNSDLSSRTEHEAASLQQTSATLSTLSSAVTQNSEHADNVRQLTERTAEIAARCGGSMEQVMLKMGGISDSSRRISEVISVIDGIAFQTNILALNAAVEAARAGDKGRGFAVVATEVGALAKRASSASKEVRQLIGESVDRVDDGARLVGSMGSTMQELVDGVDQVRALVGEISSASLSQSDGIRVVNGTVLDLDRNTQHNAALVEQMAAASQHLSGQTQRLGVLVDRFQLEHVAELA